METESKRYTPEMSNAELLTSTEPAFKWTAQRERAVQLVADDALTDKEIAAELGIGWQTLEAWKRRTEFAGRVADTVGTLRASVLRYEIGKKHRRIAKLQKLIDRIEALIEARADAAAHGFYGKHELAPGVETGLIVGKHVMSAKGDTRVQWQFDVALVKEYRAALEQAAHELGQLSEKLEITQETLIRRYVGVDVESV